LEYGNNQTFRGCMVSYWLSSLYGVKEVLSVWCLKADTVAWVVPWSWSFRPRTRKTSIRCGYHIEMARQICDLAALPYKKIYFIFTLLDEHLNDGCSLTHHWTFYSPYFWEQIFPYREARIRPSEWFIDRFVDFAKCEYRYVITTFPKSKSQHWTSTLLFIIKHSLFILYLRPGQMPEFSTLTSQTCIY
jgi:hypothetical protein